jgi:NADH/NAD ratio-sensing transcriptional regulator Rex
VLLEWRERPERLTRTDGRYSVENFLRAKAHYLCQGPLADREAVIIWGAGQMGRRISKHLERGGAKLVAFVDIDPKKIGSVKRGLPIISADDLPDMLKQYRNPVALAAVGSRGARELIRERLIEMGLVETEDFWAVA